MKVIMSLCIITKDNKILLGLKKRGFGEGRWNGFGGKVNDGETVEEAAKRELKEEINIKAGNIKKSALLIFTHENSDNIHEVHVFRVLDYDGKPEESEEMRPEWFEFEKIPYKDMWPADIEWLPLFLDNKLIKATIHFGGEDDNVVLNTDISEVKDDKELK